MKKTVAMLLCAGLLLTSANIPVYAIKDNYRVSISSTSSDILSGYYVEFNLNGTKYRSDEMGPGFNAKMWGLLNESDRRKVMKTYAFAPKERNAQFGTDGSAAMCDYINEVTGWKDAADVLKKRVEERYCNDLIPIYGDNGAHKDELFTFCPEAQSLFASSHNDERVEELKQELAAMNLLYDYGLNAYECLLNIRYQLTQISVRAISGELIQIIVDKALVPNITPAGTGGAITEIATNTFDLINSLTGVTDSLTEKVIGKRASASDVAEIVTAMSQIADADYQIAVNCANQIKAFRDDINAKAPAYYENLGKPSANTQRLVDNAAASYEAFQNADPGTNADVKTAWQENRPKEPVAPERENYSDTQAYWAAYATYQKNYEIYVENLDAYIEDAYTALSDYDAEIEALRDQAVEFCDTYGDRFPTYEPVHNDNYEEMWMITDYMPAVTAASDHIEYYQQVKENRKRFNKKRIDTLDELQAEAEALLASIESAYPPIVANGRGVSEGVGDDIIGNLYYEPDYVTHDLEFLIETWITDKEMIKRENDYMDEVMDNFMNDRAVWLNDCRQKAAAYAEAQNNYILAAVYYDKAFSAAQSLIDGLPTYVKEQQLMAETVLVFDSSYNPTLYNMLWGKTPAERDAICKRLGAKLESKYRDYLKYQRQMKAAQNYMLVYKDELLTNEIFGGDPEEFANNYEGIGAGLLPYYEVLSQGQIRYLTPEQRIDATALGLLANDLSGRGGWHADMELLYSAIRQDKSAILRNRDYDLYQTYYQKYSSIKSNASYYSVLGFGENDKYCKKVVDLLDYISEKLNYDDYVSVTNISKGNIKRNTRGAEPDLVLQEDGSAQLSVTVFPDDATEKEIVWSTNNPDIADVDGDGVVTGISCGEAVITAYALDSTRTEVYKTDEYGEQILNDVGKPIVIGYMYDPEAVTFTVTVTENPEKLPRFDEMAEGGYAWKNYGTPSVPVYVDTVSEDGMVTVSATLRTEDVGSCSVYFAVYSADDRLLGVSGNNIPDADGEYAMEVSCPDTAAPLYAKAFIFDADGSLKPLTMVPFKEYLIYE